MKCVFCGGQTRVPYTKVHSRYVHRRRLCVRCGERFTTWEVVRDEVVSKRRLRELLDE